MDAWSGADLLHLQNIINQVITTRIDVDSEVYLKDEETLEQEMENVMHWSEYESLSRTKR
jgi:hypothetical protein